MHINTIYIRNNRILPFRILPLKAKDEEADDKRVRPDLDIGDPNDPNTYDTFETTGTFLDPSIPPEYPMAGMKNRDKWTPQEKKLRDLAHLAYGDHSSKQLNQKIYIWLNDYLPKLSNEEQRRFLFKDPYLKCWEQVFKRGTETRTIRFNLAFLSTYNFVLDPDLWAGKSLKLCLFLYYIFLTKRYVVYVKEEELFYQYDGKRWQATPTPLIAANLAAWLSKLSIGSIDSVVSTKDGELIERFKTSFTIERWPYVMGYCFANGFLTLQDDRYVLLPHHPALWAKHLANIAIPEQIVPDLSNQLLRFLLDFSQEDIMNINLVKQVLAYVIDVGTHQLIININGNPRGAKTLLLSYVGQVTGDEFRAGNLRSMNGFEREQLLVNARVVHFPDTNPKSVAPQSNESDILKGISGREKIPVAHKHGSIYNVRPDALVILTNNVDFDSVPWFREPAVFDRILNVVAPSIKAWASVADLKTRLGDEAASAIFLYGLTIDPSITKNAQRSSEFNAVSGSGAEKLYVRFISEECVYIEGTKEKGASIHEAYIKYLLNADKRLKPDNKTTFYQNLIANCDRLNPRGVTRGTKSRDGVMFYNIKVGRPGKIEDNHQRFEYSGTDEMQKLLTSNALRRDAIIFRDRNGGYIRGPRLDPKLNIDMFNQLQQVKDTHLKGILEGECLGKTEKPFEITGFGGHKDVHELKIDDFEEKSPIYYQPKLKYGLETRDNITTLAKFQEDSLTKYLSGEIKPMIAWPKGDPQSGPLLETIDKDYKWFSEYRHDAEIFVNFLRKEKIQARLAQEATDRASQRLGGRATEVELEIHDPALQPADKGPTVAIANGQPQDGKQGGDQQQKPARKKGRPPKKKDEMSGRDQAAQIERGSDEQDDPTKVEIKKVDHLFDDLT